MDSVLQLHKMISVVTLESSQPVAPIPRSTVSVSHRDHSGLWHQYIDEQIWEPAQWETADFDVRGNVAHDPAGTDGRVPLDVSNNPFDLIEKPGADASTTLFIPERGGGQFITRLLEELHGAPLGLVGQLGSSFAQGLLCGDGLRPTIQQIVNAPRNLNLPGLLDLGIVAGVIEALQETGHQPGAIGQREPKGGLSDLI